MPMEKIKYIISHISRSSCINSINLLEVSVEIDFSHLEICFT